MCVLITVVVIVVVAVVVVTYCQGKHKSPPVSCDDISAMLVFFSWNFAYA